MMMLESSRFNFKFDKDFKKEQITESVAKYGIAVIKDYFEKDQVSKLRKECIELLDMEEFGTKLTLNKSTLKKVDLKSIDEKKFSMVKSLPKNEFLNFVAKDFFEPYEYRIPFAYIHCDVNQIDFNGAWHQDPVTTIKFYIYLNDVTSENGSFKYNIGSHREGFYRIMYKRHTGDYFPTFGIPDDELINVEDIEGPAGTLIIFNPMGAHTAGQIKKGLERLVIRYHFTTVQQRSIIKRGWKRLWRTSLNPVKPLLSSDEFYSQKHKSRDFHLMELKKHE